MYTTSKTHMLFIGVTGEIPEAGYTDSTAQLKKERGRGKFTVSQD